MAGFRAGFTEKPLFDQKPYRCVFSRPTQKMGSLNGGHSTCVCTEGNLHVMSEHKDQDKGLVEDELEWQEGTNLVGFTVR